MGRGNVKIPYGIADFPTLVTQGYSYVDRTDRIRTVEEAGKALLVLRPRRFGEAFLADYRDELPEAIARNVYLDLPLNDLTEFREEEAISSSPPGRWWPSDSSVSSPGRSRRV